MHLFSKFKPHTKTSLEYPPKLLVTQAKRGAPPPHLLHWSPPYLLPTIELTMLIPSYFLLFRAHSSPGVAVLLANVAGQLEHRIMRQAARYTDIQTKLPHLTISPLFLSCRPCFFLKFTTILFPLILLLLS